MVEATVCLIEDRGRFVLKDNIRGISIRKTVFPGGKLETGQTKEECVLDEVLKETGLRVRDLSYHGWCDSHFHDGTESWRVHIFRPAGFAGSIRSSREGPVYWSKKEEIPFERMWPDNRMWFGPVLDGNKVEATVHYKDRTGGEVLSYDMKVVGIAEHVNQNVVK